MEIMKTRIPLLSILALPLAACASETLPEPEPELLTPGTFVAQQESAGNLILLRTLDKLTVENDDTLIFFRHYDVTPESWDDARELAKRHDLPVRVAEITAFEKLFIKTPHRVVWYRTLSEEELLK